MSITRSITRPIVRGITRGIVRGDLDADAAAYIAAVETALSSSITADQKNAINDFIKTGKSDGWYSSIKRLYLPIWADAAANAIDMISRTSGTFTATGVDHSNVGYVYSDGSTGYLSDSAALNSLVDLNGAGMFALITGESSLSLSNVNGIGGAANASGRFTLSGNSPTTMLSGFGPNSSNFWTGVTNGDARGISMIQRDTASRRFVVRRTSSSVATTALADNTAAGVSGVATFFFCYNNNGTPTGFLPSTALMGAFGLTTAISSANCEVFTLALKDLWENASGLTLA